MPQLRWAEWSDLMSAPAIQFKGSGWYVTDYARSSNRGAEKTDGGGAAEKSDSKAETKNGCQSGNENSVRKQRKEESRRKEK